MSGTWIKALADSELEQRRSGLRNGIESGSLNMCRRGLDERVLAELDAESRRRVDRTEPKEEQ